MELRQLLAISCTTAVVALGLPSGCQSDSTHSSESGQGAGGGTGQGAAGGGVVCTPGAERVCTCYGIPNGMQQCNEDGTGYSECPPCDAPGGGGATGTGGWPGAGGTGPDCVGHCHNEAQDCGEEGVDCGGDCDPCGPAFYTENDCIKAARNGSEICDDAAWNVESPGTGLVLVCLTDAGGIIYVSTNTGPPDPDDNVKRCQGWEKTGQNAWDHLDYLHQLECEQEQQLINLDLSAYVGQKLYFGAHNDPVNGEGQFTHMCLAWQK